MHEYEKHGLCVLQIFGNELTYFSYVLQLRQKIDLYGALQSAGIVPDSQNPYQLSQIEDAIKKAYGVVPVLDCVYKDGKKMLLELFISVSKSCQLQDYPSEYPTTSCGYYPDDKVYLLPFNQL